MYIFNVFDPRQSKCESRSLAPELLTTGRASFQITFDAGPDEERSVKCGEFASVSHDRL